MAEANTGMSKGGMKKLLLQAKDGPVGCAIGSGEDATLELVMLSKSRSGAALEKMLKAEFPDVKETRFGSVSVDVAQDPKQVTFQLNKAASSAVRRLVKTLKGTGFNKVVVTTR